MLNYRNLYSLKIFNDKVENKKLYCCFYIFSKRKTNIFMEILVIKTTVM